MFLAKDKNPQPFTYILYVGSISILYFSWKAFQYCTKRFFAPLLISPR